MACPFEAAIAQVRQFGAFASAGALPPLPSLLLVLDGVDDPLEWPLCAAQAAQIDARYPSCIVPATNMRFVGEEGYAAMLAELHKHVLKRMGPTGAMQLQLSHLAIDNVGDAATLQLRPTSGDAMDNTLTFGSVVVFLPSIREGGAITFAYGSETETVDVDTSPVVTTFASAFLSTSITSAPIVSGRRVALVFRLVYDEKHEDMRLAPPNQKPAIAAFTALAHSPLDRVQRIGLPVALADKGGGLTFDGLDRVDTGLVHFFLSMKSFDVALAYCCADSEESENRISQVVLHPACGAPPELQDACDYKYLDLMLHGRDHGMRYEYVLAFWPTHHRVVIADRADALTYLAATLLGDTPWAELVGDAPRATSVFGFTDTNAVLRATMSTFRAERAREQTLCGRRWFLEHRATLSERPLTTLSRLLTHQNDLDLTLLFIADIVSIQRNVCMSELALWLHGLFIAHGWGPFQPAFLQLVARWCANDMADLLHFLASLAGLDDAPLCPPLRQKHSAELLKRCWASLQLRFRYREVRREAAIVKYCLLLEAYVSHTAPERAYANYLGDHLPPVLVSVVDGFALPSPPSIDRLFSPFKNANMAVGLAAAIKCNPALARTPWITRVLDGFNARSDASHRLVEAHLDAAASFLFLALHEEPRDDTMFDALIQVYGAGLLPGVRWIVTKHKHLLPIGFASQVVAYVTAVVPALVKVPLAPRPERQHYRTRDDLFSKPKTPKQHMLVRDAIELLRLLAPAQLPAFVEEWLHRLPKTLQVTDEVLLPVAALVVDDAPLCRQLLDAASRHSAIALCKSYSNGDAEDDEWDTSCYERAMVPRIPATIADLEMQMATQRDASASTPKRQRRA
ncbi:hypothetical protein SDRG_15022 [Saprolegnia diclina VS20]|uniref:Uncharacterized protein n=1 Tax=Saprolegnia diclina (strain VS20) TaxID=1156394 RepID=T0PXZ2_SAPDV|nr:hypothetical protein SDRG_15022 [Saprolegnia diclina VS20]EQC27121.1 hypothetical protein SDRG_15022 [Saprolegnia diclina VS20]|eukprot:XP_008619407.1 hypothetical protein SDRG_15022 [Saprolegnia diclina VS20]